MAGERINDQSGGRVAAAFRLREGGRQGVGASQSQPRMDILDTNRADTNGELRIGEGLRNSSLLAFPLILMNSRPLVFERNARRIVA